MEYYNKLIDVTAKKKALLNKTSVYLAPCLSYLNPDLRTALVSFSRPVNFRLYNESVINKQNSTLSVIVEVNNFDDFNKQVNKLRELDCYVADHAFYKAFSNINLHTFVFELDYPGALQAFLKSKYSQMYSEKDAYEIFKIRKSDPKGVAITKKNALSVCIKDEVYRKRFEVFINTSLSKLHHDQTWISLSEEDELDDAINLKQELYFTHEKE